MRRLCNKYLPPIIWNIVGIAYILAVSPIAWVFTNGTIWDTIRELNALLTKGKPKGKESSQ